MRITTFKLSENLELGLKNFQMNKLGHTVLLAGKNGSGKTRLLNFLKQSLDNHPSPTMYVYFTTRIQQELEKIELFKRQKEGFESSEINTVVTKHGIENLNEKIKNCEILIGKYKARISDLSSIIIDGIDNNSAVDEKPYYIDFVPKQTHFQPPHKLTQENIAKAYADYKEIKSPNRNSVPETVPSKVLYYISNIIGRYIITTHEASSDDESTKEKVRAEYTSLQALIKQILRTDLKFISQGVGDFSLFDRSANDMNLSDGQKILLQFCVEIHAKSAEIDDMIIFMDEPENHLHPEALIYVVDRIRDVVKKGQIWIATHSVNLIAHLQDASLFYIQDGLVEYAGNTPNRVLEGLLGDEEERFRLAEFVYSPYRYAETKFAYECLFNPDVVMTDTADKQTNQVRGVLSELRYKKKQVKLLDFGAGKGRLIANMASYESEKGGQISSWLNYVAFDSYDTFSKDCRENIEIVYENATRRYYNDPIRLSTDHDEHSFDCIVLLNVFHEIDHSKWLSLFQKGGELYRLLKSDGKLIIVEHQILSVGEKAHSKGFLMFDEVEFQTLFTIKSEEKDKGMYLTRSENSGELKAHVFDRILMERITIDSIKKALSELERHAINEIEKIKNEAPSHRNGRRNAFWSQQLAGAYLALRDYGANK